MTIEFEYSVNNMQLGICLFVDCGKPVKLNGYLCVDHSCVENGCVNERYFMACSRKYVTCFSHTCEMDDRDRPCYNRRLKDYPYCEEHKCPHAGCPEKTYGMVPCYEHRCKYKYGCDNEKVIGDYCEKHICKWREPICYNGTIYSTNFCEDHNCRWRTCVEASTENSGLCVKHKCRESGCAYSIDLIEHDFCKVHKCNFNLCNNKKRDSETHCGNHFCHEAGCKKSCEMTLKDYCEFHICKKEFCSEPRMASHEYCREHRCIYPNCTDIQARHIYLCEKHKCCMPYCSGMKCSESNYCKNHRCLMRGCNACRANINLCWKHKCNMEKCEFMVYPGSISCYLHMPEFTKQWLAYRTEGYGQIIITDINKIIKEYILN